jgi:phytoene dehydrogenase-like protein
MYTANQIRGINNLYLAGQWIYSPGGVPFALMSGYHSVFRICQKEKIKYLLEATPKLKTAFIK